MVDFAILAPVPLEHLESAVEVLRGKEYVSFGSQKWELFREVENLRGGHEVPVLIYPSWENAEAKLTFEVAWVALFIGSVEGLSEKERDEREGHRPATTTQYPEDNARGWAVFWRVKGLYRLPQEKYVPIRDLSTYKGARWRKNAPPRGPEIVARPVWV